MIHNGPHSELRVEVMGEGLEEVQAVQKVGFRDAVVEDNKGRGAENARSRKKLISHKWINPGGGK